MPAKPWIVTPLALPVGETTYEVWPCDYTVGLTLVAVQRGESKTITDESEDAVLFALVMGDTWQQMLDDSLPFPVMFRAGMAALQFQSAMISGNDNAEAITIGEAVWDTGLLPEVVAAATAAAAKKSTATPAKKSTASPASRSTATARKTPLPASLKTTKSQVATRRTPSKKTAARPSPGKR